MGSVYNKEQSYLEKLRLEKKRTTMRRIKILFEVLLTTLDSIKMILGQVKHASF